MPDLMKFFEAMGIDPVIGDFIRTTVILACLGQGISLVIFICRSAKGVLSEEKRKNDEAETSEIWGELDEKPKRRPSYLLGDDGELIEVYEE